MKTVRVVAAVIKAVNERGEQTIFVEDEGWHMAAENPKATYACVNYREAVCPHEIEKQSICIEGDIGKVLSGF